MANRTRTAWRHLRASLTHFWSSDVINVIFRKTAITPSFIKIKTSSITKLIPGVISNDLNHKIDRFLQRKERKNVFQNVTMVTKNVACLYLSNGDR